MTIPMSKEYKQYADCLEKKLESIYSVARDARKKGLDPSFVPEPEVAKDLAELVEGLVGPSGVADSIRELSEKMSREALSFKISEQIIHGKFGALSEREAAEQAIRTALAKCLQKRWNMYYLHVLSSNNLNHLYPSPFAHPIEPPIIRATCSSFECSHVSHQSRSLPQKLGEVMCHNQHHYGHKLRKDRTGDGAHHTMVLV